MTVDSLADLRDVHLPPAPWFWSLPEWLLGTAILALLAAIWYGYRAIQRRGLRAALQELDALEAAFLQDGNATRLVRGLSRLLRRYAIARFPQEGVAGLTGQAWLQFLESNGGAFRDGVGDALAVRPYQASGDIDAPVLIREVRRWMKVNPR